MNKDSLQTCIQELTNCSIDAEEGKIVSVLARIQDYLSFDENPSESEFAGVILHEETGVWKFFGEIRKCEKLNKPIKDNVLNLMIALLEKYDRWPETAMTLFCDFCKKITFCKYNFDKREFGYRLLIILLNSKSAYFDENEEFLITFMQDHVELISSKLSKEKQLGFQLFATLIQKYPHIVSKGVYYPGKLARNIKSEMNKQKEIVKISEIEGMIECLHALFDQFPDATQEYNAYYYKCLEEVMRRETSKHVACRGVMKIIEHHFDKFSDFIKKDHEMWLSIFKNYLNSSNKDDSETAMNALYTFYPNLAKMCEMKTDENVVILKSLIELLKNDIKCSHGAKMMSAVKNYVHFSHSCRIHGNEKLLEEMNVHVISLLEQTSSKISMLFGNELSGLSDLVWAASKLLLCMNISELKTEDFRILEKTTALVISTFPKVPKKMKSKVITNLIDTIIFIAYTGELHLNHYLETMVYDGLVSSCSHMTENNVELLKDTCEVDDKVLNELISYKNFIGIWANLLNIHAIACENSENVRIVNELKIEQKIFDNVIGSTLKIIDKLNLNVKNIENDFRKDSPEMTITIEYDSFVPCSDADRNIFDNLVELFSDLFSNPNENFEKWVNVLIPKFISYISRHEIKFGFYKLLNVIFKHCRSQENLNIDLIKSFIINELNQLDELKKTDLKACLQMILNIPDVIVVPLLSQLTSVLQASFNYGIEDLSLADETLDTFRKWYLLSPKDDFKPVLREVIPFLKPFIQSKRFIGETDAISQYEKQLLMSIMDNHRLKKNRKFQEYYFKSTTSELEKLQNKVVKFVGEVEIDIWLPVFSSEMYIAWNTADILFFDVPFVDMKVRINLDKILPRVMELIKTSGDLKTRIAACEVLHPIVHVFIGNTHHLKNVPNLFKKLVSFIFELGCDDNQTVQQLFRPLSMQMTRFYSSMKSISNAFLEILFDALITVNHTSLRNFAAELIREFVKSSLEENTSRMDRNENVLAVIKRICLFCMQPCSYKKLGAALAFNKIYKKVKKYKTSWMELLIHFVMNLSSSCKSDCNNNEVIKAIDHLCEEIYDYPDLLQHKDSNIVEEDLQEWLFKYCFSFNQICRTKCMEILTKAKFPCSLPNFVEKDLVVFYFNNRNLDIEELENIDKDLSNIENLREYLKKLIFWLNYLSASLHCFWWLLQDNKKDGTVYFINDFYKLRISVGYFIQKIMNVTLETYVSKNFENDVNIMATIPHYEKQYCVLQNELIFRIFKILGSPYAKELLVSFQHFDNLWDIFVQSLFDPFKRFFTLRQTELSEVFKAVLNNIQNSHFPLIEKNVCRKIETHDYWNTLKILIIGENEIIHFPYTNVLYILDETDILSKILKVSDYRIMIETIFKQMVREDNEKKYTLPPNAAIMSDLQPFITFVFEKQFELEMLETLIFNQEMIDNKGKMCTHGMYFFQNLKPSILIFLQNNSNIFIQHCLNDLNQQKIDVLRAYLDHAIQQNIDCSVIFTHWNYLENWCQDFSTGKILDALEILELTIRQAKNEQDYLSPIFKWLLECLRNDFNSSVVKPKILNLVLLFFNYESFNRNKDQLSTELRKLFINNINNELRSESVILFNKILERLENTANPILFELVMEIAALKGKPFIDNIPTTIVVLMRRSSNSELQLLRVCLSVFRNESNEKDHRFQSVEMFLIPMLKLASDNVIIAFFINEIKILIHDAKREINRGNEKNILVLKTGAMLVLETYYDVIKDVNNEVIKGSDDTIKIHQEICKTAREILLYDMKEMKKDGSLQQMIFRMKCCAYSTLISAIRKSKIETKIEIDNFNKFCEFPMKKEYFKQIIPHDTYRLTMSLKATSNRRKLIRKRRQQLDQNYKKLSLTTECFSQSSLSTDLVKFDMNHYHVNTNSSNEVTNELIELIDDELENDELNNHECMKTLCDFIKSIHENSGKKDDIPMWMKTLRNNLREKSKNMVLLILRLIVNCEFAFNEYATFWFPVLIETILWMNTWITEINYVITDIIIILLEWRDKVVPQDQTQPTALLNMFIDRIDKNRTTFRKYQMEIIRMMIQVWLPHITIPSSKIQQLLENSNTAEMGLEISRYFLWCNVHPFAENADLNKMLQYSKIKPACEVFGLILRVAKKNNEEVFPEKMEDFKLNVIKKMNELRTTNAPKTYDYFTLIEHLIKGFPDFVKTFSSNLLHNFPNLQGEYRSRCLKLLTVNVSLLEDNTFSTVMETNKLEVCLHTDDHNLVQSALNFIKSLIDQVDRSHIEKLLPSILRLSDHTSPDCRGSMYDLVSSIYEKYSNCTDERDVDIKKKCKAILLRGLFDQDSDLQKQMYTSWKTRIHLQDEISQRFLTIINEMYSPCNETTFVSYAVDYLLEASSSTEDYHSKVFSNPLQPCDFENYKIISSWRTKSLFSTPLFANSLPVQLASMYSQNTDNSLLSLQLDKTLNSPAPSISLQTFSSQQTTTQFNRYTHPLNTNLRKKQNNELKKDPVSKDLDKLKRRIVEDSSKTALSHAIRNSRQNEKRIEILKERSAKRDKCVELRGQYRQGKVPFIEIVKKDVILPLQKLSKRDPIVGKQVFIHLLLGIANKHQNKLEYLRLVNEIFNSILKSTEQRDSTCLEAIFEITYSLPEDLKLDLRSVALATNMSSLLSLRALLLENLLTAQILSDVSHSSKKSKNDDNEISDSLWIQLAEVYKSLDQYDIVNGIMKEKITNSQCQPLKNGLQMETAGEWGNALNEYIKEVDEINDFINCSQNEKFILDAYYKCASYLSEWADINKRISNKCGTLENVLKNEWHKEYTLPWMLHSEVYERFREERIEDDNFEWDKILLHSVNDKFTYDLAEPLSLLHYIYQNIPNAVHVAKKCLKAALAEFNFLDSSIEKFLKIQTLSEINILLMTCENQDNSLNKINDVIQMWERNEPGKTYSTWWDRRIRYRHHFAAIFLEMLDTDNYEDMEKKSKIQHFLKLYELKSSLQLSEKALKNNNFELAGKYTINAATFEKKERVFEIWPECEFDLALNFSKIYLFKANKNGDPKWLSVAIEQLNNKFNNVNFVNRQFYYESLLLISKMLELVKNKQNDGWNCDELINFCNRIVSDDKNLEDLNSYIVKTYEKAASIAETGCFSNSLISSAYLQLAKHCRASLNEENELCFEKEITKSILKAMKFDSNEACHLFMVLLQMKNTSDEEFSCIFKYELSKIEEWKFLPWINQLLVYVNTEAFSNLLDDLIVRIAEVYPNAITFPFILNHEIFKNDLSQRIKFKLMNIEIASDFIKAISFVCEPDRLWKEYKIKLKNLIKNDNTVALRQTYEDIRNDFRKFSGEYYLKCNHIWDSCVHVINNVPQYKEILLKHLEDYELLLRKSQKESADNSLFSYTAWLMNMPCNKIEIPGQYSGFSVPYPERHIKIYAFHEKVENLLSVRKPKKIKIIGNNGKEYSYLVKFQEDLRQDQRIQQLFRIMNQALETFKGTYRYHIHTYEVYPLKENLGIIEWVEDSLPLKDFIHHELPTEEKKKKRFLYINLRNDYHQNLMKSAGSHEQEATIYHKVIKQFDEYAILRNFREILDKVPHDIFKSSLFALSNTSHLFWCLRNQFITSYSTMSICNWILGIGDRHLGNILVSLKTGTCVGIDFGYAFGTSTDYLPIPELIPFRMTPRIIDVMAPFYLTGLIRETMIHIFQTVRVNDYVLLATTPIFIKDPSIDWLKCARKSMQRNKNENEDLSYLEKKINNVKLKLEGYNPIEIFCKELETNPNIIEYCDAYKKLIQRISHKRKFSTNNLKTEELVNCLLELATDEHVLGTSYSGLETWI